MCLPYRQDQTSSQDWPTTTMNVGRRVWHSSFSPINQENSPEDIISLDNKSTLEEKLHLVGRPHSLRCFKELRDGILKDTYLQEAQALLKKDSSSTRNCSLAIKVAANALWPRSCHHRPNSEPRGFSLVDASLHQVIASVLVEEKVESDRAAPMVVVADGRGKVALEFCSENGLYNLFDTILDCEVAYLERQHKRGSELGFTRSPLLERPNKDTASSRLKCQNKLLLATRKGRSRRHQKQSQAERWITAHKARDTAHRKQRIRSSRDGSTGRYRTNLPQTSLRSALFPFEYDLRFMDCSVGMAFGCPSQSFARPRPKARSVLRGVSGCPGDANEVKKMMQQTIAFLETRNVALAEDLRELKARLFKEIPMHESSISSDEEPPPPPTTTTTTGTWDPSSGCPEETAEDKILIEAMRDEIHVICSDVSSGVSIYVQQEFWGVRRWVITIHLQNGT